MLSKPENHQSLQEIVCHNRVPLDKGGIPAEFKVKSGESRGVYSYRVYPELVGLWTKEYCKPSKEEFFRIHEKAKMLLDFLLITDGKYEVFYKIFDGLTHVESYKLAKYALSKDLVGKVVQTVNGPAAKYAAYADAVRQLSQTFALKIDDEVKAGKINQKAAGLLFNKLTQLQELYLQGKFNQSAPEDNHDKKQ